MDFSWEQLGHVQPISWANSWVCLLSYFKWVSRKKYKSRSLREEPDSSHCLYILCLDCIYYKTYLGDSLLYHPDSWAVSYAWRTVPLTQGCTCPFDILCCSFLLFFPQDFKGFCTSICYIHLYIFPLCDHLTHTEPASAAVALPNSRVPWRRTRSHVTSHVYKQRLNEWRRTLDCLNICLSNSRLNTFYKAIGRKKNFHCITLTLNIWPHMKLIIYHRWVLYQIQ
jgi:hypothetical protein